SPGPRGRRSPSSSPARASATTRAAIPNANHMKFCNLVNTPYSDPVNKAILGARLPARRRGWWFFGLTLKTGHESGQRLKQLRERDGGQDIGLGHARGREPEVIPKLPEPEADRCHQQD